MSTPLKISNLIDSQAPEFIKNNSPLFIEFLEAYYEYMEQANNNVELGKLVDRSANITDITSVDGSIDLFSSHLYSQYLNLFPKGVPSNRATIVKNIKDFYRSKGSEKSYRFLFHALFGKDVDIYYPRNDILIPSSAKWFVEKSIRVSAIKVNGVSNQTLAGLQYFVNTQIEGVTSEATAIVERVLISFESGTQIYEIFLSNQEGSFSDGENVTTTDVNGNVLVATIVSGIITEVTVTKAGAFYNVGDQVLVQSNSGSGAIVFVSGTTTGNVKDTQVLDGGAGFRVGDQIIFTSATGAGANAFVGSLSGTANSFFHANTYNIISDLISVYQNVALNSANYGFPQFANANSNTTLSDALTGYAFGPTGPIATITITANGSGYATAPTVDVVGNTSIKKLGVLGKMSIVNPGLNYAINDKLVFNNVPGGFGTGATGNVISVNANGAITHAEFRTVPGFPSGGTGFDPLYLPTVSITSSNGTGANVVITALLGYGDPETSMTVLTDAIGAITSLSIGNPGSLYANAPTLNLKTTGDGTAQAFANIVVGTYTYPGRFLDETGFPSGFCFLQDQDYYQNFAYVVRVKQSIDQYRKYVKNLVHPAGMKLWGQYEQVNEVGANLTISVANTYQSTRSFINVPYTNFTTGYLTRTTAFANTSNSMNGYVSLWFNTTHLPTTLGSSNVLLFMGNTNTNPMFSVTLESTGNAVSSNVYVKVLGKDIGGNTVLDLRTNVADVIMPNNWTHLEATWDMANSSNTAMYLTGTSSKNVVTFVANSTISYNVANIAVAGTVANTSRYLGNLSQLVFNTVHVDFTNPDVQYTFISSDLLPINVVATGSIVTGLPPIVLMSGNTVTINTNGGLGGDFALTGTVTGNTMLGLVESAIYFFRITDDGTPRITDDANVRITEGFDP